MGLLSTLASIGGAIAAPVTGGASLAIPAALQAAGSLGSVLGKQEQGAAAGRVTQAQLQQQQDQNALANYIAQQNAQNTAAQTDLQRKAYETQNRSATARQAVISALLGGLQPTQIDVPGVRSANISGGLMASLANNPQALDALRTMQGQASTAQRTPVQFQGGQLLTPPVLSKLAETDNGGFLSTLARIGQIAGAAGPYIPVGKQKPTGGIYDSNGSYVGE